MAPKKKSKQSTKNASKSTTAAKSDNLAELLAKAIEKDKDLRNNISALLKDKDSQFKDRPQHTTLGANQDSSEKEQQAETKKKRTHKPNKRYVQDNVPETSKRRNSPRASTTLKQTTNTDSRSMVTRELASVTSHLIHESLSKTTRSSYKRFWVRFQHFCTSVIKTECIPATTEIVASFISYLFTKGFASSTICSHLSAIAYYHQLQTNHDPTKSFIIQRMTLGCKKIKSCIDSRLPLLLPQVHNLVNACPLTMSGLFDITMFQSIFLFLYHGFFRVGELLPLKQSDQNKVVQFRDVQILDNSVHIIIRHHKTQKSGKPIHFYMKCSLSNEYCPRTFLVSYLKLRGLSHGPLYLDCSGQPICLSKFRKVFRQALDVCNLPKNLYKPHSFRIGACTQAIMSGVPVDVVKEMGRWRSNAYRKYIRIPSLSL